MKKTIIKKNHDNHNTTKNINKKLRIVRVKMRIELRIELIKADKRLGRCKISWSRPENRGY